MPLRLKRTHPIPNALDPRPSAGQGHLVMLIPQTQAAIPLASPGCEPMAGGHREPTEEKKSLFNQPLKAPGLSIKQYNGKCTVFMMGRAEVGGRGTWGRRGLQEIPDQTSEQAVLAPTPLVQADRQDTQLSEPRNPCPGRHWSEPRVGVRVSRSCVPPLTLTLQPTVSPCSSQSSLLGAWMPGPAQAMSKQKMARQENLQRTPAHPQREGRSRQLVPSCRPSAVTIAEQEGEGGPQGQARDQKKAMMAQLSPPQPASFPKGGRRADLRTSSPLSPCPPRHLMPPASSLHLRRGRRRVCTGLSLCPGALPSCLGPGGQWAPLSLANPELHDQESPAHFPSAEGPQLEH